MRESKYDEILLLSLGVFVVIMLAHNNVSPLDV